MVPVGLTTIADGDCVALGIAVGKAALPASRVGTAVGADGADGADVACGFAVGEVAPLLATGVAVAEDPQANSRATNNRTIALGQCLTTAMLDPGLVMVLTPVATIS
jgi:hypothetical protein